MMNAVAAKRRSNKRMLILRSNPRIFIKMRGFCVEKQVAGFYRHMGFETYKRTEYDEQGNPYPLLYMKLA